MISNARIMYLLTLGFLATIHLVMPAVLTPIPSLKLAISNVGLTPDLLNMNHLSDEKKLNYSMHENDEANNFLKTLTPAQKLIDSISKEDLGHFIVYHLAKGLNIYSSRPRIQLKLPYDADIPVDKYLEFKNMKTYDDFSKDLLIWTKDILATNNTGIEQFVKSKRACPPWGCFDPNDVGHLCCPF